MEQTSHTRTVYLDHAATTPVDPDVAALVAWHTTRTYGNASAMYGLGRAAQAVLEDARAAVAASLHAMPEEIIFTGSGTESDNLALLGAARAQAEKGRHIVISNIEHKAVMAAAHVLESEGFSVTQVPADERGIVSAAAVEAALQPDTILVSLMYANNEIGTIQPVAEVAALLRELPEAERPLLHTDACQAVGQLPVLPHELGVDLLTLNSSKIYGPKGVGALWVRRGVPLQPLLVGGDQEHRRRAGTENIALIAGFALALEQAVCEQVKEAERLAGLRDYFLDQLYAVVPELLVNGDGKQRLPNNLHITIPELEGESLVLELDRYGVCAATGSACSANDLNPSHVLRALGVPDELTHGSLRFTLGRSTTEADLDYAADSLAQCVERLRAITATTTMRNQVAV